MPDADRPKRELRARYRELRRECSPHERQQADRSITDRLLTLPEYRSASMLLTYVSSEEEIDTLRLIVHALAEEKTVACPRCDKSSRTMSFHIIRSLDELFSGAYGISEPAHDAPEAQPEDMHNSVCIVPGLAFDGYGGRLGYGGGYYDRFLAGYSGISVGLCRKNAFSAQPLPQNEFDVQVDIVVTDDSSISSCRSSPEQR